MKGRKEITKCGREEGKNRGKRRENNTKMNAGGRGGKASGSK